MSGNHIFVTILFRESFRSFITSCGGCGVDQRKVYQDGLIIIIAVAGTSLRGGKSSKANDGTGTKTKSPTASSKSGKVKSEGEPSRYRMIVNLYVLMQVSLGVVLQTYQRILLILSL